MSNKKRTYSPDFKTKVVLELLSGEKTLAQVVSKYDVTAASLKSWKKKFLENASMAFDLVKQPSPIKMRFLTSNKRMMHLPKSSVNRTGWFISNWHPTGFQAKM